MMTRYYHFAGVSVAISMPRNLFYENENRLEPFRTDETETDWTLTFECVEHLSPPRGNLVHEENGLYYWAEPDNCIHYIRASRNEWDKAPIRVEYYRNAADVQIRKECIWNRIPAKTVLESMAAEHMIARNHGFLLHCSFVERAGKAILFTAPSGTGKSTQAELWKQHRGAEIINGDRAAVRLENEVLLAEGIPFAGSSEYCENRSLPIAAIVYLGQANHTSIRKLQGYEAFAKIWEGISVNTWDKTDMELVSAVAQKATEKIPVFCLSCTPDESAVIALEEALRKLVSP